MGFFFFISDRGTNQAIDQVSVASYNVTITGIVPAVAN